MKIKFFLLLAGFLSIFGCSNNKNNMKNPLMENFGTLHNTVPFDRIKIEHFRPAFEDAFSVAQNEIDEIINNTVAPDFENTIEALAYGGSYLDKVSSILFNLNSAETNDSIQELASEMSPRITEFTNNIFLNEKLFAKVKKVFDETDKSTLSTEQKMLLEKTYKQFVRNGVNLNDTDKERFRKISKELSELSVKFAKNTLAETNSYTLHITDSASLSGLPEGIISAARDEATTRELDGWVFTLQYPSFGPFMQYADNRNLRRELFLAYASRGNKDNENDNREIVRRMVDLRLEKAKILGYKSYADFVLEERMAENTDRVYDLLNNLLNAAKPFAKEEHKEIQSYANSLGFNETFEQWDWLYYSEKLKKAKYNVDDEATRPYFELDNVITGIFSLADSLYGLSFRENNDIPVYHPDVKRYEVFDENDEYLAVLYMDFFPREGKRGGAWMTDYQDQMIKNGKDVRPHISLVFNFTKPAAEKPSLLTYREVQTLLHEFGHGLHGMLSDVTYPNLSGTNVYWDFVELPSQIMENWSQQAGWLNQVAVHYKTGEKIPQELLQNILDAKNFLSGYATLRQLSFGFTDIAWHTITEPYPGDIEEFEVKAMDDTQQFPHIEGTIHSTAFSHLFSGGYASGYYSYKWAEVLDADAFSVFLENGIFDKETAASFRKNILSKGGTEHPMDLYIRFRGQEPTIQPLLVRNGLIKE